VDGSVLEIRPVPVRARDDVAYEVTLQLLRDGALFGQVGERCGWFLTTAAARLRAARTTGGGPPTSALEAGVGGGGGGPPAGPPPRAPSGGRRVDQKM
jgi:hypothetical protein